MAGGLSEGPRHPHRAVTQPPCRPETDRARPFRGEARTVPRRTRHSARHGLKAPYACRQGRFGFFPGARLRPLLDRRPDAAIFIIKEYILPFGFCFLFRETDSFPWPLPSVRAAPVFRTCFEDFVFSCSARVSHRAVPQSRILSRHRYRLQAFSPRLHRRAGFAAHPVLPHRQKTECRGASFSSRAGALRLGKRCIRGATQGKRGVPCCSNRRNCSGA